MTLDEIDICCDLSHRSFQTYQKHKTENALVCKEEGCYLVSRSCKVKDSSKHNYHPTKKDKTFLLTNEQVDRIMTEGAFLVSKENEFFLAEIAFGKVFRVEKLKEL